MRIAIFHDHLSTIEGGGKFVLILAKEFDADVITTDFNPAILEKLGIEANVVNLGRLANRLPFRQIHASFKFSACDFSDDYDFFVLSGSWAHYAGKRHHPNLFYCHAPVRVFYDLRGEVIASLKPWQRSLAKLWIFAHSRFDRSSVKNVDFIVANSTNVKNRIKRCYGRDADVVYPPVNTSKYRFEEAGDFWLSVNRLHPEKRIELQIETFKRLPNEKLKIVGGYSAGAYAEKYIRSLERAKNIEFLGETSEEELIELYSKCKGLLATALDEDFGLTPLEAMASGKVVLATNEGGYRETVINGVTGWLLSPCPESFIEKIKSLDNEALESKKYDCIKRAKEFDETFFIERMKRLIEDISQRSL